MIHNVTHGVTFSAGWWQDGDKHARFVADFGRQELTLHVKRPRFSTTVPLSEYEDAEGMNLDQFIAHKIEEGPGPCGKQLEYAAKS